MKPKDCEKGMNDYGKVLVKFREATGLMAMLSQVIIQYF